MIINGISNNELGITFNGIHSRDFGLRLRNISDPLPTLTDVVQDVQPIIGDVYQGTNIQSKTISVTFHLVGATSYQDKYTRMHDIMAWLMPLDGDEYALTLDILPNRTFYAHVSGSFDLTDSMYDATFTVPFTCSDPRAYGPMRQYQIGPRNMAQDAGNVFTSSAVAGQQTQLYVLDGAVATYNGKMSLKFDWSASVAGTVFKVQKAVVEDNGFTAYTDICTVTAGTTSGTQVTTVTWNAIADNQMAYLAYQQVAGTASVQIYNLQLTQTSASGFGQVINATTNEIDNRLIDINADNTVTLHDDESTAESFPVFILKPTQEITKIAIAEQDGDDYLYLGSDVDPDTTDEVVNNEPTVVADKCQTLDYWHPFANPTDTSATTYLPPFELENAVIGKDSAMTSHPNSIGPGLDKDNHYRFSTKYTKKKWNGTGAIHAPFPSSYEDWEITARLEIHCRYPRSMGKVELYLLDQNNARMGKLMLKDVATSEDVYLQAQIGTHAKHQEIYYSTGKTTKGKTKKVGVKVYKNGTKKKSTVTVKTKKKKKEKKVQYSTEKLPSSSSTGTYTNFYGNITMRKVGNRYTVSIMKLTSEGKNAWKAPITAGFTDSNSTYSSARLANVAVYFGKYPITEDLVNPINRYKNDKMYFDDLKVKEIIDGGNDAVRTPTPIAGPGDEIHISTADGTIYKNGQMFNSANGHLIKAAGSNLIGLSLQGAADKTLNFYPVDGWSVAHQPVFY